ncbi:flagellin [Porticoccaceae bacterium]|nr:flagellin [Porticoccaceae bacterium]
MASINTNMSANTAANSMARNERSMASTMERLSTGLRINSAKDDAAGLAISSKMTSQIRGLNQAVRNANDAISMIQVAEGAMKEVTNMVQRMRELAVQAISDSNTSNDRGALNNEYKQLSAEIARIGENTQWNGTNILDGSRTNSVFQIGANADQTIAVDFGNLASNNISASLSNNGNLAAVTITFSEALATDDVVSYKVTAADGRTSQGFVAGGFINWSAANSNSALFDTEVLPTDAIDSSTGNLTSHFTASNAGSSMVVFGQNSGVITLSDVKVTRGMHVAVVGTDILTSVNASSSLSRLDAMVDLVNSARATLGASMSRLEYAADNLQNVSQNSSAARSRVLDADYASETTELARTQIIQQASTAMLAQANQAQQSVLSLLK